MCLLFVYKNATNFLFRSFLDYLIYFWQHPCLLTSAYHYKASVRHYRASAYPDRPSVGPYRTWVYHYCVSGSRYRASAYHYRASVAYYKPSVSHYLTSVRHYWVSVSLNTKTLRLGMERGRNGCFATRIRADF